jgi:tripartite-type tricarboxylate transporter receptor subunit TctC
MHFKSLLTLAVCLGFAQSVNAEPFPSRPVTLVVPYAAGGATDALARTLGRKLTERLNQPVVIENRPGAGTIAAAQGVARAKDAHTLLMATSTTMAINVSLHRKLPYDPTKDFVPVALICAVPFVLVVNPTLPVHSADDLVRFARERPQSLAYASAGPGSPHHLFTELFKGMTGIELQHVPYKGSAPALNDVIAGHVALMFVDLAAALGAIENGSVRVLGVSSAAPVAALPAARPIVETLRGFDISAWQMIVAPAGASRDEVRMLHAALNDIMAADEVRQQLASLGLLSIDSPPQDLGLFVKAEIGRWAAVVARSGAGLE